MFSKKSAPTQIASLIGSGSTVVGDLVFAGGLRIDGIVRGAVRCVDGDKGGMLVISETGHVEGEVQASHLVVAGRITGPVHASELLELQPKARVNGDVRYKALEMHHGAIVDGLLVHDDGATATKSSPPLKLAATSAKSEGKTEVKPEPKVESIAG
jgi:cytoskeletal protein CcmA (bactofilin family)